MKPPIQKNCVCPFEPWQEAICLWESERNLIRELLVLGRRAQWNAGLVSKHDFIALLVEIVFHDEIFGVYAMSGVVVPVGEVTAGSTQGIKGLGVFNTVFRELRFIVTYSYIRDRVFPELSIVVG